MSIFQKSVIQKYLRSLNTNNLEQAYNKFKLNYSLKKIEKIMKLKEEEYQDGFLRDLFVDILGYTLKPEENFNLVREFKNQTDGKKADGAIIKDEKAVAVIELKSTKTKDLTNITQQAFNYKNNQPGCKYVITSNFHKLRFYIDYSNEYEEFDLFNLQKTDFDLLYLILRKNAIFLDIPQKLKDETKFHEQNVSEQLYKDYSNFKNNIFENLVKNNPNIDKLTIFKKSQKLLDRLLFIFFAEDCGLLPANSISRIIERYEQLIELDAYKPLYDIYKQYFGYMNIGRKGKIPADDIPAYNGGLFAPDKILDNLKIDDKILKKDSLKLSAYDFNTDVDVNILGHIFEHSLNEIEEIEKNISDNTVSIKSKRKKDGVFYTPKYITQYIVENTIGKICTEKRKEMQIYEIEFDETYRTKKGLNKKGKELFNKLNDYKKWLLSIKILDPACGSGAFLNQALNFLISEHRLIDDLISDLTGDAIGLFDTDKAILENNLYGVDINDESVEIAKLSLWLRTAQKGRKLSNLNNNIKCGNSLISDPKTAEKKAFDWNNEFKEIMKKGGFDIIIGNPPYVQISEYQSYYKSNYETANSGDLYALFIEKGTKLLKQNGNFSFIIPSLFIKGITYKSLRNFLLTNTKISEILDKGDGVFADVKMPTAILTLSKEVDLTQKWSSFIPGGRIIEKLDNSSIQLSEISNIKRGLEIGRDKVTENGEIPLLTGGNISRYNMINHMFISKEIYKQYQKENSFFSGERIIIRETGNRLTSIFLTDPIQQNRSLYSIKITDNNFNPLYPLCLLNSSLIQYYYVSKFAANTNVFPKIRIAQVKQIPIKTISKTEQQQFIEKAKLMLSLNKDLQSKTEKFVKRIKSNLEITKITKKIQNFYNFDFKTFIAELKKQKIKLNFTQQDEWEDYFDNYKKSINDLQNKIKQTDNEIDKMVYKLYELTTQEIEIIENSIK